MGLTTGEWDDYDEVFHCTRLIETIRAAKKMTLDFHFIRKNQQVIGILLATHGELDYCLFFQEVSQLELKVEEVVIFNYFHVAPEGRGNGEFWLKDIILLYYQRKGRKKGYIKSSHPKVFSLYERLGKKIGTYTAFSNNRLIERQGEIFELPLFDSP